MTLIDVRDAVASRVGGLIGAIACAFDRHVWEEDKPKRGVYLLLRHCVRCPAKEGRSVKPGSPWVRM